MANSDEPSPVPVPKNKWFLLEHLGKLRRYDVYSHTLVLNSNYPDVVNSINQSFPLLPALAKTYIAIDRLNSIVPDDCLTSPEAMSYIIQFTDAAWTRDEKYDTIESWDQYMESTKRLVSFAPDFTQWDEDSKEIEGLAIDAIATSKRVLKEHKRAGRKLPKEVVNGIYVRTELLKRWTDSHLQQVRYRTDYVKWKAEQDASPPNSQLTKRRGYPADGTSTVAVPATISTPLEASEPYKRSSKPRGMELYFQSDLTIWTLNLAIYLTCAILQATSTSRQQPPSPPDYLATTQTTLTQLLSVLMTYILTIRNDRDCRLGIAYLLWFVVAAVLPLVGLGVLRWNGGVSALVMFLGTAVTGVLQVLLAVYMKRVKVLPS